MSCVVWCRQFLLLTLTRRSTLTVTGTLSVSQSAVLQANTVVFGAGSMVTPVLTAAPAGSSVTVVVATFGSSSGTPIAQSAVKDFPDAQCVQLGAPQVATSATTLSVTIAVQQLCGGGGLSTGALIGIIVGASVLGLALIIAVVGVLVHRRRNARAISSVKRTLAASDKANAAYGTPMR